MCNCDSVKLPTPGWLGLRRTNSTDDADVTAVAAEEQASWNSFRIVRCVAVNQAAKCDTES